MLPIPLLAPEYLHSLPAPQYTPYTHYTPWHPSDASNVPQHPLHALGDPQCTLMPHMPLPAVNCLHFSTDCLHTARTLIFYHCHFQLSSLCNWPSSQVHPVYKIPSLGTNNTSSVLWSSANFCSISKNIHYKDPVASQHWKTKKVVWTWKDDWPTWRTSIYERPFTREGNYFVFHLFHKISLVHFFFNKKVTQLSYA